MKRSGFHVEKWQLEKIAKKHRSEGSSSTAAVGGRKKWKGQQKGDLGAPCSEISCCREWLLYTEQQGNSNIIQ